MRMLSIATTQMACGWDRNQNITRAGELVAEAAAKGAQVVLLQELFETPYFCMDKDKKYFKEATTTAENPAIAAMRKLAAKHNVVIPVSFYERDGDRYFNSLAMIDAGGELLGVYRKSHIPDFQAYEEAFYFSPGDTGFMVFDTKFAKLGAAVCWDQWFPETARVMALKGAEVLLFPTAIGRPTDQSTEVFRDSKAHWQNTMIGHAAANMMPLVTSNRIGVEEGHDYQSQFYGSSFITDHMGRKVCEAGEDQKQVLLHKFDLDETAFYRKHWGIFSTRRTDLYGQILDKHVPPSLTDK